MTNQTLDKVQKFLNKYLKIEVHKYPNQIHRARQSYLKHNNIDIILDVGANTGQFALDMFGLSYTGQIISFEPVANTYSKLVKNTKSHFNWTAHNIALGDVDGGTTINVCALDHSSSLLPFAQDMTKVIKDLYYEREEKISVKKLDTIFDTLVKNEQSNIYLKIDTQGFEKKVLDGAINVLHKFKVIQLELSLVEIYAGELTMVPMIDFLKSYGFSLWSMEPIFYNPHTYQLLQVDAIFIKS